MKSPSKIYLLIGLFFLAPNLIWASKKSEVPDEGQEEAHDKKPVPKLELNEAAQTAISAAVNYHKAPSWEKFAPLLANVTEIPEKHREFAFDFSQFGIRSLDARDVETLETKKKEAFATFQVKHEKTIEELDARTVMTYGFLAKGMEEKARDLGKSPKSPFFQGRFLTVFRLPDEAKKAFLFAYKHEGFKKDGDVFRLKCALLLPLCGEAPKEAYLKAKPLLTEDKPYFKELKTEEEINLAKTLLHAATRTFCDLEPTLLIRACITTKNFFEAHHLILHVIKTFGSVDKPEKALLAQISAASNGLIEAWQPNYPEKELKALTLALAKINIKPDILN